MSIANTLKIVGDINIIQKFGSAGIDENTFLQSESEVEEEWKWGLPHLTKGILIFSFSDCTHFFVAKYNFIK